MAPPSIGVLVGHRRARPIGAGAVGVGAPTLADRRHQPHPIIAMVLGTLIGIASGHYRGLFGAACERLTDWFLVIPFIPLVIVLAAVFGQQGRLDPDCGARNHVVAGHGASGACPDAQRRGPALYRASEGAGQQRLDTDVAACACPTSCRLSSPTRRLTVAHRHPVADDAGLPRPRTDPYPVNWGIHAGQRQRKLAPHSIGAWWYLLPPGICVIARGARPSR